MMSSSDFAAFEQFVQQRRRSLSRIVRETHGEYQFNDVVNEAWLMACYLASRKHLTIDFLDKRFQGILIAFLGKRLIAFQEKKIRNGVRPDHAPPGSDEDSGDTWDRFEADDSQTPETLLLRAEAEHITENRLATHPCLTAAYLRLLEHFDNRMQAVADHLLISKSHAYRCRAKARRRESTQNHFDWPCTEETLPRPWRRFKIHRLTQNEGGQLNAQIDGRSAEAAVREQPGQAQLPITVHNPPPCC